MKYTRNPIRNNPKKIAKNPSIIPASAIPFPLRLVEPVILLLDMNPNIIARIPKTCASTGTKKNVAPTIPSVIDAVDNPECLFITLLIVIVFI